MTTESLSHWLANLGLAHYASLFAENEIDLRALPLLSESDLRELGVKLGARKILMQAIDELADGAVPAARSEPAPAAPEPHLRHAERRQLTVMFCDLVGSTQMSQHLDPETLRDLMQTYQQTCAGVIERYSGHVAQYLGDGLMVYFGWPEAHEDDAQRAVRSALDLVEAVKKIAVPPAPTFTALSVRIGIATGSVVVGETGNGDAAIPKTAIGETPNLAARMQGLAQADQILVAPATHRLLGKTFAMADHGKHVLKGIKDPVHVWRITGLGRGHGRFETVRKTSAAPLSSFVGRDEELSLLLARWRQSVNGEGQVAVLSGEAGIGKSRLIEMLEERIAGEPHLLMCFHCSPHHRNSALYPFIDHIHYMAGFEREDSVELRLDKLEKALTLSRDALPTIVPLLAPLLSLPAEAVHARYPTPMLSAQRKKELTLAGLADHVDRLSKKIPVFLTFEDAQWADPTSLELLDLFIPRAAMHRVFVLLTHRPEFTPAWLGQGHVTSLHLTRLTRAQGADIARQVTGGKALPDEVLAQILDRTDGVPLFVEELTTTVLEAGFLVDDGARYRLDGPLPPLAVPTTLQDSLMARLDRLGPIKELAQVGACIGREFTDELIAKLLPMTDERRAQALRALVASGLVAVRGTPPDASYSFKQALVQQAAYDSLLNRRRQQIHGQIAETLKAHFADAVAMQPELLARHYTEAGDIDQALPQWLAAARLAAQGNRNAEAFSHIDAGLALAARLDAARRADFEVALHLCAGFCHIASQGYGSELANASLARAEALLDAVADVDVLDNALWAIGMHHLTRGDLPRAKAFSARLLAQAQASGDLDREVFACAARGAVLASSGDGDAARPLLEFVVEHYVAERHARYTYTVGHDLKVIACGFLCGYFSSRGFADQARRCIAMAIDSATQVGHPFSLATALSLAGRPLAEVGESQEALRIARRCIELCEEQHFPYYLDMALGAEGIALERCGEHLAAAERIAQARARVRARASDEAEGQLGGWRAIALANAGLFDAARQEAEDTIADMTRHNDFRYLTMSYYALGLAAILDPAVDEAEAEPWLLQAIAEARRQNSHIRELRAAIALAGVWQRQGRIRDGLDLLAPCYAWFTEGFDCAELQRAAALLGELQASDAPR